MITVSGERKPARVRWRKFVLWEIAAFVLYAVFLIWWWHQ